jgi:uncharacterized protein YfiM (DUF2279 family)
MAQMLWLSSAAGGKFYRSAEAYAGTCYKASNWEAVGFSAGYSRHRADFYLPYDRPKRLWLHPR